MPSFRFKYIPDLEERLKRVSTDAERLELLQDIAWHCYYYGMPQADDWMKQAHQLLSSLPENPQLANHQLLLEVCHEHFIEGETIRALETANRVIAVCSVMDDEQWLARAQSVIGYIYMTQGQYGAAREAVEQLLNIGRRLNDPHWIGLAITGMGMIQQRSGDDLGGLDYLRQSIAFGIQHDDSYVQLLGWYHSSNSYVTLGRYDEALEAIVHCFELAEEIDNPLQTATIYGALSDLYMQLNDLPNALEAVQNGISLLSETGRAENLYFKIRLGCIYAQMHRYELSLQIFTSALEVAEAQQIWRYALICHQQLITIYKTLGHLEPLTHHYDQLLIVQKQLFNDESDQRLKTLEVMHRTQQAQAEADLQRQLREVDRSHYEQLARIKDDIIEAVSHDLKSPLSSMDILLTMLTRQIGADPKALEYIERLRYSMLNMRSLITDVLDLAQIETGQPLEQHSIAAETFVRDVIQPHKVVAFNKNISLKFDSTLSGVVALFDPVQIRRVIDNLISNAIKYTPNNGTIEVKVEQCDDTIVVRVIDDGPGISQDDLLHIFERFYRVKNGYQAEQEGTGLGLSIARSIVEKHRGKIWVDSEINKGSVFSFSLPLTSEKAV